MAKGNFMTIVWLLNSFFTDIFSWWFENVDTEMYFNKNRVQICCSLLSFHTKPLLLRLNLTIRYSNIADLFLFCVFFFHSEFNLIPCNSEHAIFIVDPLTAIQAGTIWRGKVHVHFWWIVHVSPYSIWIESLFEGQWFSSVRVFPQHSFFRGEEYL